MRIKLFICTLLLLAVVGGIYFLIWPKFFNASAGRSAAMPNIVQSVPTSTPPTVEVGQGLREYANGAYHFKIEYPDTLQATEYKEANNALTVTFVSPDNSQSFEVYVTPYNKAQIDQARFKLDEPSGTFLQPQNVLIDGTTATMFYGRNGIMGDTREVWFIKGGFLYEVATYKDLDTWLGQILQSWKFI